MKSSYFLLSKEDEEKIDIEKSLDLQKKYLYLYQLYLIIGGYPQLNLYCNYEYDELFLEYNNFHSDYRRIGDLKNDVDISTLPLLGFLKNAPMDLDLEIEMHEDFIKTIQKKSPKKRGYK